MKTYMLMLGCLAAAVGFFITVSGAEEKVMTESGTIQVFSVEQGKLVETNRVVKTDEEWKRLLTPEQFEVTRGHGTERAFTGAYCEKPKGAGIYKCVACGNDLFVVGTKFESGTGWPSFYQPVNPANVGTTVDSSFFMSRTEVHCSRCGSHLGHVFEDGPAPTGLRYCINSVSLTFVPQK